MSNNMNSKSTSTTNVHAVTRTSSASVCSASTAQQEIFVSDDGDLFLTFRAEACGSSYQGHGPASSSQRCTDSILEKRLPVWRKQCDVLLESGGGEAVAPVFSKIDLSTNEIGDAGVAALMRWLLEAGLDVEVLDLQKNRIGDYGALAVANFLRQSNSLLELHMTHNFIGKEGFKGILEALAGNYAARPAMATMSSCPQIPRVWSMPAGIMGSSTGSGSGKTKTMFRYETQPLWLRLGTNMIPDPQRLINTEGRKFLLQNQATLAKEQSDIEPGPGAGGGGTESDGEWRTVVRASVRPLSSGERPSSQIEEQSPDLRVSDFFHVCDSKTSSSGPGRRPGSRSWVPVRQPLANFLYIKTQNLEKPKIPAEARLLERVPRKSFPAREDDHVFWKNRLAAGAGAFPHGNAGSGRSIARVSRGGGAPAANALMIGGTTTSSWCWNGALQRHPSQTPSIRSAAAPPGARKQDRRGSNASSGGGSSVVNDNRQRPIAMPKQILRRSTANPTAANPTSCGATTSMSNGTSKTASAASAVESASPKRGSNHQQPQGGPRFCKLPLPGADKGSNNLSATTTGNSSSSSSSSPLAAADSSIMRSGTAKPLPSEDGLLAGDLTEEDHRQPLNSMLLKKDVATEKVDLDSWFGGRGQTTTTHDRSYDRNPATSTASTRAPDLELMTVEAEAPGNDQKIKNRGSDATTFSQHLTMTETTLAFSLSSSPSPHLKTAAAQEAADGKESAEVGERSAISNKDTDTAPAAEGHNRLAAPSMRDNIAGSAYETPVGRSASGGAALSGAMGSNLNQYNNQQIVIAPPAPQLGGFPSQAPAQHGFSFTPTTSFNTHANNTNATSTSDSGAGSSYAPVVQQQQQQRQQLTPAQQQLVQGSLQSVPMNSGLPSNSGPPSSRHQQQQLHQSQTGLPANYNDTSSGAAPPNSSPSPQLQMSNLPASTQPIMMANNRQQQQAPGAQQQYGSLAMKMSTGAEGAGGTGPGHLTIGGSIAQESNFVPQHQGVAGGGHQTQPQGHQGPGQQHPHPTQQVLDAQQQLQQPVAVFGGMNNFSSTCSQTSCQQPMLGQGPVLATGGACNSNYGSVNTTASSSGSATQHQQQQQMQLQTHQLVGGQSQSQKVGTTSGVVAAVASTSSGGTTNSSFPCFQYTTASQNQNQNHANPVSMHSSAFTSPERAGGFHSAVAEVNMGQQQLNLQNNLPMSCTPMLTSNNHCNFGGATGCTTSYSMNPSMQLQQQQGFAGAQQQQGLRRGQELLVPPQKMGLVGAQQQYNPQLYNNGIGNQQQHQMQMTSAGSGYQQQMGCGHNAAHQMVQTNQVNPNMSCSSYAPYAVGGAGGGMGTMGGVMCNTNSFNNGGAANIWTSQGTMNTYNAADHAHGAPGVAQAYNSFGGRPDHGHHAPGSTLGVAGTEGGDITHGGGGGARREADGENGETKAIPSGAKNGTTRTSIAAGDETTNANASKRPPGSATKLIKRKKKGKAKAAPVPQSVNFQYDLGAEPNKSTTASSCSASINAAGGGGAGSGGMDSSAPPRSSAPPGAAGNPASSAACDSAAPSVDPAVLEMLLEVSGWPATERAVAKKASKLAHCDFGDAVKLLQEWKEKDIPKKTILSNAM